MPPCSRSASMLVTQRLISLWDLHALYTIGVTVEFREIVARRF